MQTVNPALYPGEGALRCSAIVNFARGEIPRPFLQKPRAIRPRASVETFRRKSRKEKGVIGLRAGKAGAKMCEKKRERERKRKRARERREKGQRLLDSSFNLFYTDLVALFDSLDCYHHENSFFLS